MDYEKLTEQFRTRLAEVGDEIGKLEAEIADLHRERQPYSERLKELELAGRDLGGVGLKKLVDAARQRVQGQIDVETQRVALAEIDRRIAVLRGRSNGLQGLQKQLVYQTMELELRLFNTEKLVPVLAELIGLISENRKRCRAIWDETRTTSQQSIFLHRQDDLEYALKESEYHHFKPNLSLLKE